jgi:UDP-glucose 4-epimerase
MAVMVSRTALVTGGSGFIGKALLRHLQRAGYRLNVLTRQSPEAFSDLDEPVQIYHGALADTQVLEQACADMETVFHLAAFTHVNRVDRGTVFRTNVEGTALLLEAAVRQRVRRIVYFSSSLADEHGPDTSYGQSKRAAEKLLLDAARRGDIEVCCLRPVNVYGPGMKGNLASMIRLISLGLFPPLPELNSRLSLVGVDDLCQAAVLAAQCAVANGQIYPVTDGQVYTMNQLEQGIRTALGQTQPRWSVPLWVLHAAALKMEVFSRLFRLHNLPGLHSYRTLTSQNVFSNEKISQELGYTPSASFFQALAQILPLVQGKTKAHGSAKGDFVE